MIYEPVRLRFAQLAADALLDRLSKKNPHTPELTGSAPRNALRAEPPEDEFAVAKNPLTEGARARPGHVIPFNILNIAAAVADEVVMLDALRIEARGAALDGHFTHQARLHQVPQIVISRGPGRARIHAIYGFGDFRSRWVPIVFQQECHHSVALRSASQSAAIEGSFNCLGVH
jgi:hypothetical protein